MRLLTEVVPQVEKQYNISTRREDEAIAGLSMGGLEALMIGLNHTDKFAWVGGFSAAVHLVTPADFSSFDARKAKMRLVYIGCGTADDLIAADRQMAAALIADGQPVVTFETPGVGHVWAEWRPDLVRFASRLFQPN